jgi:Right handed beta helix region/Pectate lyase superfamily protein
MSPLRHPIEVERRTAIWAGFAGVFLIGTSACGPERSPLVKSGGTTRPPTESPQVVNVRSLGAVGNGYEDDTEALNRALQSASGRTIGVPAGTYLISVDGAGDGLVLSRPKTRLIMAQGAVIKLKANARSGYAVVRIAATDCSIEGGSVVGDVESHEGNAGEWGHGIQIGRGADRCVLRGVKSSRCWGDGIYIAGHPADVSVIDCVSDNNRRQGLSIVDALRPSIIRGYYTNTGSTAFKSPSAGIDIEPNGGVGQSVIDANLTGVTFSGNRGSGLLVSSPGGTASVKVQGCNSSRNSGSGYEVLGLPSDVEISDSSSSGNGLGFNLHRDASGVRLKGCSAETNLGQGFLVGAPKSSVRNCRAQFNGRAGFYLDSSAKVCVVTDSVAIANCQRGSPRPQVDVWAPDAQLVRVISDAGVGATRPNYGFAIRASAVRARLTDCVPRGTFSSGPIMDFRAPNRTQGTP